MSQPRRVLAFVVAGTVLGCALVATLLLVVGGRMWSDQLPSPPEDVVDTYLAAVKDGDCGVIIAVSSGRFRGGRGIEDCEKTLRETTGGALSPTRIVIGEASVDGRVARVPARYVVQGKTVTRDYRLGRYDGRWLIDDVLDAATAPA